MPLNLISIINVPVVPTRQGDDDGDAIRVLTRMWMTESERLKEVEDELKAIKEKEDGEVERRIGEMRAKMMADLRKEKEEEVRTEVTELVKKEMDKRRKRRMERWPENWKL